MPLKVLQDRKTETKGERAKVTINKIKNEGHERFP